MNSLQFFTSFYGILRPNKYLPNRFFSPLRYLTRLLANYYIPRFLSKNTKYSNNVSEDIVVSLTSFPARINHVWKVIKCLKNQDVRPRKIILWLSKDQFPDAMIPSNLQKEIDDVFSIVFVGDDIRSHKKYYYAMRSYPQNVIITVDDDVFYKQNMISSLLEIHKLKPHSIVANTTSIISYNKNSLMKYNNWERNYNPKECENLIQIGVGGVLYPPGCLHSLVLEKDVFMSLAPLADDIWLNAMARLKGTHIIQSGMVSMVLPIDTKSPSLSSENVGNNENDIQIHNIRKYCEQFLGVDPYSANFVK